MVPTTMATMEAPAARITVPSGGGGGADAQIYDSTNYDGTYHNAAIGGGGGGAGGGNNGGSACPTNSYGANGDGGSLAGTGGSNVTNASGGVTSGPPGQNGTASRATNGGNGGSGLNPSVNTRGGGGGGAGWNGGGGGASDNSAGGGGGAGSSLIAGAAPGGIQTFATDTSGSPYATVYWIDITTSSLGSGSINHAYSDQVAGTFGAATAVTGSGAQWTVSPSLPAGLTLDPTTGAISGTPTVASPSSRYTFTATWSSGGLLLAQTSKALTLSIASPSTPTTGTTTTEGGQLAKTGDQSALLLLGGGALVCAGAIASRSLRRRRSRSL